MIAGIAREVIRRLREAGPEPPSGTLEKLITIETLDRYTGASEIGAAEGALITPAAREEASRRGITFAFPSPSATAAGQPTDDDGSDDATSGILCHQLSRRGLSFPRGNEVAWTDQPASEVYRRCGKGQRAVMITSLADVDRFAGELSPNAWVLDRQKLNLVAAVNVAARIARTSKPIKGVPQ